MPGAEIYIITHAGLPDGAPEDRLLAAEISRGAGTAEIVAWEAAGVDWSQPRKVIIRSAWNYHQDLDAWNKWVDRVSAQCHLINDPTLLRWNADKRYLLDLQQQQIPIVPTMLVDAAGMDDLERGLLACSRDIIIKPAVGASAAGVRRFKLPSELVECHEHIEQLSQFSDVLVQPFQAVVEHERERSLVYIGGIFTHAFTKPAFHPGISAGTHVEIRIEPSEAELALAERILGLLPLQPVYARIDLVPGRDGPLLMELELIEPHLAFHLSPDCCARLAEYLIAG